MNIEIPDDYFKMMARQSRKYVAPDVDNPAAYPRSEKIVDDRAIMLLTEADMKVKEIKTAIKRMEVVKQELELIKSKLYSRLEEVYPAIDSADGIGVAIRKHDGATYYVGWDDPGKVQNNEEFI